MTTPLHHDTVWLMKYKKILEDHERFLRDSIYHAARGSVSKHNSKIERKALLVKLANYQGVLINILELKVDNK